MTQIITRSEIKAALDQHQPITLVEALPEKYYKDGHLPNALQINYDEVDAKAPSVLPDKSAKIVVYCSNISCPNSGKVATRLVQLGYTNVYKYVEGKQDWIEAGLSIQKSIKLTKDIFSFKELGSNRVVHRSESDSKSESNLECKKFGILSHIGDIKKKFMLLPQSTKTEIASLLLRISLAIMWLAHAGLKFFVFTIPGFAGWLESQGLPAFMAWPVFLFEVIGGILILFGIYGRYVSMLLLPVLVVAMSTHIPNGWVHTSAGGGWEYPLFLIVASIVHTLLGDGKYAVK